jgi:hypothetical protein
VKKKTNKEEGKENSYPKKHSEVFDLFYGSGSLTIEIKTKNVNPLKLEECLSRFGRDHAIQFDIHPDSDTTFCQIHLEGHRSFGELRRRLVQLKNGPKKIECEFVRIKRGIYEQQSG